MLISQLPAISMLTKLSFIRPIVSFFARIGRQSLSIYFLHGLFYMWMIYHSLSFDMIPAFPRELVLLAFSLLVTFICSQSLLSKLVHLILHFPYKTAVSIFKLATR